MIRQIFKNLEIHKTNTTKSRILITYVMEIYLNKYWSISPKQNDKVVSKKFDMTETLNHYLTSLFTVKNTDIQEITPAQPNLIPLNDCDFPEDAVTKAFDEKFK